MVQNNGESLQTRSFNSWKSLPSMRFWFIRFKYVDNHGCGSIYNTAKFKTSNSRKNFTRFEYQSNLVSPNSVSRCFPHVRREL